MDWSWSSSYITPSDTLGSHGWETVQPNNPQDGRPFTEPLPLSLSTDFNAGHLDEALHSWSKLNSAFVEFGDTECFTGGGMAYTSRSFIGPELESIPLHDAEDGLALANSSKPATEPVAAQPKVRYMGESLARAFCERRNIAKDSLLCPWEGCKKPGPFSRKSVLARHLRAHTNPSAFKCVHCFKQFDRKDNMSVHVRRMHENQV